MDGTEGRNITAGIVGKCEVFVDYRDISFGNTK